MSALERRWQRLVVWWRRQAVPRLVAWWGPIGRGPVILRRRVGPRLAAGASVLISRRFWLGVVVVGLATVLVGAVAAGAGWLHYRRALEPVSPGSPEQVVVWIAPGSSTRQIGELLKERGLIRDERAWRLYLRLTGQGARLQAGEYALGPALSLPEIVERILRGQVITYPLTIPEGLTVAQVRDLLVTQGWARPEVLDALLADVAAGRSPLAAEFPFLLLAQGLEQPLEGYLFPDTYRFPRTATEEDVIRAMLRRFQQFLTAEVQARAEELGMTLHQAVTLASIIEREAQVDEERPIISGVYHNRLRVGMKLDADPTLLYALGNPPRPLLDRDKEMDSPYNTYRFAGLPPGPICNPGEQSLRAALYPADVPYFYFVARNDGTHAFARTLQEHVQNARRYQPR